MMELFMCNKTAYKSRKRAHHAARILTEHGIRVHAYICPLCHFWHVGH